MRKERAHAGEVLFGLLRVDLVIDFVVFERNGEKAIAVDAAHGGAGGGVAHAELKPKKIAEVDEQEQGDHREEYTAKDMAEERRGASESGWRSGHELLFSGTEYCRAEQLVFCTENDVKMSKVFRDY